MKFWLEIQRRGDVIDRREIAASTLYGEAEGACPNCGAVPFLVAGVGIEPQGGGIYRAGGKCSACGDSVGYIFAEKQTLFGKEEDGSDAALRKVPGVLMRYPMPDTTARVTPDLSTVLAASSLDAHDWEERANYAYAYCRIHGWTSAYMWARCLLHYGNRAGWAFKKKQLQDELRTRAAKLCSEALNGEGCALVNFTIRDGRLAHEKVFSAPTSFSREHPLFHEKMASEAHWVDEWRGKNERALGALVASFRSGEWVRANRAELARKRAR